MQNHEDEKFKHTLKKAVIQEPDAHFIDSLEQRLLAKAPIHLGKKSFFNPLSMFFRFSRKFPSALVASFLVVIIIGGGVFQMNQNGPQEILNKAYAYYEAEDQKNAIYYEKNYYESSWGDETESYILELWYDDLGNNLSLQIDPVTGEIETANLIKISSKGQAKFYDTLPQEEDSGTQPFLEENFYCVDFYKQDGLKFNTTLMISAQDTSIYSISGWSEEEDPELTEQQKFETIINELESGKSSPERTKLILQTLKKTKDLQDKKITEKGKSYHVFTMDINTDVQIHYYINSDTYRLEKMTETLKDTQETIFIMEYLESEYLDNSEAENIFNPEKYGLHPSQMLEAGNPSNLTENGCYKTNGDKMTPEEEKEFWSTLPPSAKIDMEAAKADQIETITSFTESPLSLEESVNDLTLDLLSPLKGGITQGFTNTHAALDFASMLVEESVVAADDGVVSSVSKDNSWNGGHQNTVVIDHANGIQTFYARLGAVEVEKGDIVKKGDVIAKVDNENGYIHFELRLDGKPINPSKQGLE